MSVQALFWATQQNAPAMQKIVLVMIANRLNKDSGACFPSLDTLAKDCGMSRRTVINQIAKLEASGLLSVERSNKEHVKQNNNYQLGANFASAQHTPAVNTMHRGSEPDVPEVVNKVHLKQVNITNNLTTTKRTFPSTAQHLDGNHKSTERSGGYLSEPEKATSLLPLKNCSMGTDTKDDPLLIFPLTCSPSDIKTALNLLRPVAINDHQLILDVLIAIVEGNEIRKSVIACLGGLIKRYHEGTFDASPGDKVRTRRKQQALNQQRTANNETVNHEQIMAQLAALTKSIPKPNKPVKQPTQRGRKLKPISSFLSLR